MNIFNVKLFDNDERWMPIKSHYDDAGFDLKLRTACGTNGVEHSNLTMVPGDTLLAKTGVYLELKDGYEAQIRPRSGLALEGLTIVNSPGTIDSGYRNEIGVILHNLGRKDIRLNAGDRIAQMVIKIVPNIKLRQVSELGDSNRGLGGFGSTGVHSV